MDRLANNAEGKQAVLRALAVLYPWMQPFFSRPVRDYACRLFDPPVSKALPDCRVVAFNKLLHVIRKAAIRNRLPDETVAQICRDFENRRVLQTGPHLLLILEPEACYTHAFSLLGLAAHGCSTYVSYAVSTVSLVESSRKGPGWLTVDGKAVNIFGLSRSRMIGYGLLTALGPYRFELVPVEPEASSEALAQLRDLIPPTQFEKPARAIKAANIALWPKMFGNNCAFLQIDDEDVADLVVDHLSDETSWLHRRLLGNPKVASGILEGIDHLAAGPWAGWLARGTDFFWFYENGKRMPLRLSGEDLVHHAGGAAVVRFTASEIIGGLLNRSLIPNMVLAFLVLAILPGVRVLGGSRQPIYYPLIRYVVSRASEAAGIDADLQHSLATDDVPGAWGHRVIERNEELFDLFKAAGTTSIGAILERLGNIALTEACGGMSGFVRDLSWRDLWRRLEAEKLAAADPQWALA